MKPDIDTNLSLVMIYMDINSNCIVQFGVKK